MKVLFIIAAISIISVALPVHAQSASDQLTQMVQQLQNKPDAPGIVTAWPRPQQGARGETPSLFLVMAVD